MMSHSSVNFDKSGFAEDVNLVFPLDRFRELRMRGAREPCLRALQLHGAGLASTAFEAGAIQVAALLKRDQVDAVFLTPV